MNKINDALCWNPAGGNLNFHGVTPQVGGNRWSTIYAIFKNLILKPYLAKLDPLAKDVKSNTENLKKICTKGEDKKLCISVHCNDFYFSLKFRNVEV